MNVAVKVFATLAMAASAASAHIVFGTELPEWSGEELAILRGLQLHALPRAAADPSNKYEGLPEAASLGKKIFFDQRFSANQQVSCASCHSPALAFQDNRALGQGIGTGLRRTMPIVESGRSAWQFWDGRKDSVWSQALGPLEDPMEHGGNRTAFAKLMGRHYRSEYEAIFKPMPDLDGLPAAASPNGSRQERQAWEKMSLSERHQVSEVFANIGKAIAAYEKNLRFGPSRLDDYIAATLRNQVDAPDKLDAAEKRGLRLFIGKAQCVTCHAGPLFTDQHFHNTGVPARASKTPEQGRRAAVAAVLRDEFNCLGPFSDAKRDQCRELEFIADDDPHLLGAFKTPSLRNVAARSPYMHAGQIASLADVVRHYASAPRAALGQNERQPVALSESEIADMVTFLATLSGPIVENTQ
jgi:cytochrome c peroxidase